MSKKDLNLLLEELRLELTELKSDSLLREEVVRLINEIEQQLQLDQDSKEEKSLADRIRSLIGRFEVEHPRLTNILSEIMNKLSNIGI